MTYLRLAVVTNTFLVACAFAEPIKPGPVTTPTVVIAANEGHPILAAQVPTATYPSNTILEVRDASGGVWRDEFFETPELLCAYRKVFSTSRDRESESRLFSPKWCSEQILEGTRDPSGRELSEELSVCSLVARFRVGTYTNILVRTPSIDRSRSVFMPCVIRDSNEGRRITFEVIFNSSSQFLFGMLAGDIMKGTTQEVSPDSLRRLVRFRMTLDPPTGEAKYATTTITWDPPGRRGEAESEEAAVFVYVALDADPADGFGRELLSDDDPGRFANRSAARAFREIFRKAWDTDDPEAEKEFWQSGHHRNLDEQRHRDEELRRQVPGTRRPPKTSKSFPGIAQGAIDRGARLIASVDFGVGSLHFLQNPDTAEGKSGKVVPLAMLNENDQPRLCYSLGPLGIREGEWSGLLKTPEFLSAIADYACQRR